MSIEFATWQDRWSDKVRRIVASLLRIDEDSEPVLDITAKVFRLVWFYEAGPIPRNDLYRLACGAAVDYAEKANQARKESK